MPLKLKDLAGFGVVAGTLVALAVHADDGHQRSHIPVEAANLGLPVAAGADEGSLALVGFHVVQGEGTLRDQTVVILGDRVHVIGPAGSVELPEGVHAIQSSGDEWIVSPGFSSTGFRMLRVGSVANLLVLSEDPRGDPDAVGRPAGRVDAGVWAAAESRIRGPAEAPGQTGTRGRAGASGRAGGSR